MVELYKKINGVFQEHASINKKAMACCQSFGYNGFKRMHRCLAKEFFCFQIELSNELFDKYRIKFDESAMEPHIAYNPMSLKEHLSQWDTKLANSIKVLGDLNKEYFNAAGVDCKLVEKALCCLVKKYKKAGRWYKRFEETGWLAHDMHYVDDRLHDKYKDIEGG